MGPETTRRRSSGVPEVIDLETFRFSDKRKISTVIDLSDEEDDDDVRILNFIPKRNNIEKGESSNPNNTPFVCEICTDTKTMKDAFYISGCSHVYCSDCVAKYIGSKLEENIINIQCPFPGCSGLLEAEFCRSILPVEVFERWGKALCEALLNVSEKFYCPFPDCSALLINDGTESVIKSECPNCNRIFCAQCKVPWHEGIKCSEFEKLNADEREKDDVMLMNLAKDEKWRRCPNCRIYVAKSDGCNTIRCRWCGCSFCYNCGVNSSERLCNCFMGGVFYRTLPNFPIYPTQRQKQISSGIFTGGISTIGNFSNGNPIYPTLHEQIRSRVFTSGVSFDGTFLNKNTVYPTQRQEQIPSKKFRSGIYNIGTFPNRNPVYPTRHEQIPSRVFTSGVSPSGTFLNRNTIYPTQRYEQIPSRVFTGGISTIESFPNRNSVYPTRHKQMESKVFTSEVSTSGTFFKGKTVYPTKRQKQIPTTVFRGGVSTVGTFPNGNLVYPTKQEIIPSRVVKSEVSTSGTFPIRNTVYPTQRQE